MMDSPVLFVISGGVGGSDSLCSTLLVIEKEKVP